MHREQETENTEQEMEEDSGEDGYWGRLVTVGEQDFSLTKFKGQNTLDTCVHV